MNKLADKVVVLSNRTCRKDIVTYGLEILAGETLCAFTIIALGMISHHLSESLIYLGCIILATTTMGGVSL